MRQRYSSLFVVLSGALLINCSTTVVPKISQITPAGACDLQPTRDFTILGSDFLNGSPLPQVTFTKVDDPNFKAVVTATALTGCTDQNCTSLTVSVPKDQLPLGQYRVTILNSCNGDCVSKESGAPALVDVVAAPVLTDVTPKRICAGAGTLALTGSNFYSGGTALLGSAASMSLNVASDGLSATANFAGPLPLSTIDSASGAPVPFDVTMRNAIGCESVLPKAVVVTAGPSVLFVDPPAVPAGYSIQATVYGSGISGTVQRVQLAPAGTTTYTTLTLATDPSHPNRVLVTLPANLAAGGYDILLDDQTGCSASLPNALKVVGAPTLTVAAPTPAFGSPAQNTAVAIAGAGFVSTPRAYAAINGGGAGVSAAALQAVTFRSSVSLSAVIPKGLSPGLYDLLVINPDGSFGIKTQAFTVTQANAPPPVITSIAPSSVIVTTAASITINGRDFRAPQLAASCFDAANAPVTGAVITVGATTAQSIAATLNAPSGSVYCVVRVTDTDNSTFFDYSAVGVTNASLNLTGFKAASNLQVTRRALAASTGRPTEVARFVYALGGDAGTDNTPRQTVEAASTGLDGGLTSFFTLSQSLPKALSFLGVVNIGRFLYAVGGFDGTAAVATTYRAELLDPLDAPQFSDVDVRVDQAQGLAPGLYVYRISAVMQDTDANNPGGETLAGDFFPIQLPQLSAGKLQLVLSWSQVVGAKGYRIYRTPAANGAAGSELLLAAVNDSGTTVQSYVDNGSAVPAGATALPLGSTGAWRTLGALNTARAGAGVVAAPDPTVAGTFYLYALGGNSGTPSAPTLQTSVEFMTVTLASGGAQQNTTAWTTATRSLPSARWLVPGLVATRAQNSVVPAGQVFIYAGTGLSSSLSTGTLDRKVYYAQVGAGGQPGTFTDTNTVGVIRSGFGAALVNNQMIAFGGFQAGTASTASDSATLSAPTTLTNFNALGSGTLLTPRSLQGTAIESAFIYQLGGVNNLGAALSTSEQTIW